LVSRPETWRRRLCLHGLAVEIECNVRALNPVLDRLAEPFNVADLPEGFVPLQGSIAPYNEREVLPCLSGSARRLALHNPWMELYQEEQRFWIVDERWGMAEINLLRGQFRSWILPRPATDSIRIAEAAILWPMAQLVRQRGLHLMPAAAVSRSGFGVLLLCPIPIEPELMRLARAGYRLVAQQWTALREEDRRISMLHVPGAVERGTVPRPSHGGPGGSRWVDLSSEFLGSTRNHSFCDLVLIAEPGRRPLARADELSVAEAIPALRRAWPIIDLHPPRRWSALADRIARLCRCAKVQLSHDPADLLTVLDSLRMTARQRSPRVTMFVRDKLAKSARPSSAA
jgi:hypothetical protein